jgi:hypothetical protein
MHWMRTLILLAPFALLGVYVQVASMFPPPAAGQATTPSPTATASAPPATKMPPQPTATLAPTRGAAPARRADAGAAAAPAAAPAAPLAKAMAEITAGPTIIPPDPHSAAARAPRGGASQPAGRAAEEKTAPALATPAPPAPRSVPIRAVSPRGAAAAPQADVGTPFRAPAAPSNDAFNSATLINASPAALPFFDAQNTASATTEAGEPTAFTGFPEGPCDDAGQIERTVWYRFSPTNTFRMAIDATASDFDTVIRVFSGTSLTGLTGVACNDQFNNTDQSRVSFTAVAGTQYRVQIGGFFGDSGNLAVSLSADNDSFSGAINVPSVPAQYFIDTTNAGVETGENTLNCSNTASTIRATVWYTFRPTTTQQLTLSTFSSDFDTIIRVYTGSSVANLTPVPGACNDDFGGTFQSELTFTASAGVTYSVQAGGYQGATGGLWLSFGPPANDHFTSATLVSALSTTVHSANTRAATEDLGEALRFDCDAGDPTIDVFSTVWYRVQIPSMADVKIDTSLSNFDTVIRVYTGTALSNLSPVACNDQFTGHDQAQLVFRAQGNTSYYVQVGGYFNSQGDLRIRFTQALPAPANDNFAAASAVAPPAQRTADTRGATGEAFEPDTCGAAPIGSTVWYRITGGGSLVTIDTFGSNFDTVLAVYTGSTVGGLNLVACNDDSSNAGTFVLQSRVAFTAQAGVQYVVQVGGYSGATGSGLVVNFAGPPPAPANNDFNPSAPPLSLGAHVTADTRGATLQSGEPFSFVCDPEFGTITVGRTVWYNFSTGSNTAVSISTAGSTYDTVVRVHTGTSVGALTPVDCSDQFAGTDQSRLTFNANAGVPYRIQVSGFADLGSVDPLLADSGTLVLDILQGVANDNFDAAAPVAAGARVTANTANASTEPLEPTYFSASDRLDPQCRNVSIQKTVWYRVTGTGGSLVVNTSGSSFDTVLRVYTGAALGGLTPVACNDDAGGLQSQVQFATAAGVTYWIQAGGYYGASGNLVVNVGRAASAGEGGESPGETGGAAVASAWSCAPVQVSTGQGATPGTLQVSMGAPGVIQDLVFGGSGTHVSSNELVDIGGQTDRSGAFTVPIGTTSAVFTVRQRPGGQGQATTVYIAVRSASCGTWNTFVGGGPAAFAPPGPGSQPKLLVSSVDAGPSTVQAGQRLSVDWRLPDGSNLADYQLILARTNARDGDEGVDQKPLLANAGSHVDWLLNSNLQGVYEVRLLRLKPNVSKEKWSRAITINAAPAQPIPAVPTPATTPVPAPITAGPASPDRAGDVGQHSSVRLDSGGNPVVSYYDVTSATLKVLHCGDPTCSTGNSTTAPDPARGVGQYSSLALDASGRPVISYYDASGARLKVLRCGDPNCTRDNVIVTPDPARGVGQYTSLALDASGHPVVSYYDASDNALKLLHCGDPTCGRNNAITTIDRVGNAGRYTSLALDSLGNPVISYYDAGESRLRLVRCGNPNCSEANLISSPDEEGAVGQSSALALDAFSRPVVSYYDATNSRLKLLRCDDPACVGANTITALNLGGKPGESAALALDLRGNPVISYHDQLEGSLRVLRCGNLTCTAGNTIAVADPARGVGQHSSLVLDASGRPVVSYYDAANGDLKVVHCRMLTCN